VLLAYGALERSSGALPKLATKTIVEQRVLSRELEAVRQRGYAVADGELEDGLVGVAAPVRDGANCVAAVCVSGPRYRVNANAIETFVPECRKVAAQLEARLGSTAKPVETARVA
jgi:DNA-binding IclR family transcriptional regulator